MGRSPIAGTKADSINARRPHPKPIDYIYRYGSGGIAPARPKAGTDLRPKETHLRGPIIPLLLGVTLAALSVIVHLNLKHDAAKDLRGIAALRRTLDTTRVALASAANSTDSARIATQIAEREYYLGRREFHLPLRQATLDGWWRRTGPGTLLLAAGGVLIAIAGWLFRRDSRGSA